MKTCYTLRIDPTNIAIADLVKPGELTRDWTITRINVPRGHRGRGIGRALLREILAQADYEGVRLQLEVAPSDGLNYEQLVAWYDRYGFRFNGYGYMTRKPQ